MFVETTPSDSSPNSAMAPSTARERPHRELEAMPIERLEHEIGELAAHISAATCRWLLLVAEFDRREGYLAWGARTCAHWLSWRCGVAIRAARENVRVALSLADLPAIRDSFSRGELSYSKVRALSRVATPALEDDLLDLARHATAAQLERVLTAYRGAATVDEANEAHERRFLDCSWEDDGSLAFRGRISPEEGAVFLRALDAARESCARGEAPTEAPDEQRSDPSTRFRSVPNPDALVEVAETSLAAVSAAAGGGDRFQVVVHVDPESLAEPAGSRRKSCGIEDGPAIPAETARRLSCDAALVRVGEAENGVLSVGRKTRTIPPSLRRALQVRDRGCRFPGCNAHRHTDAHHLRQWADGGETSLENLCLLCRFHHRLIHEGGFSVHTGRGRKLIFRRPDGRTIRAVPEARRSHPSALGEQSRRNRLRIGRETCAARSANGRLDLDLAVSGLLARAARE